MPTGECFVYETKNGGGIGRVIGKCSIWRVKRYENVSLIPEGHIDAGCVPYDFLVKYSKGKPLYAHFIVGAKVYDKPKELNRFALANTQHFCHVKRPPQSWCYVEELQDA